MAHSLTPMRIVMSVATVAVLAIAVNVFFLGTAKQPEAMSPTEEAANSATEAAFDLQAAMTERRLGSPDAPIKLSEHSSFTCGHCGAFHKGAYKQIKENYIDTGKVELIFSDFPLNRPALDASKITRCLPQERYFDFVQLLFETQDKWAYEQNYLKYLKQNAQLAGLSAETAEACLNSEALQNGIWARIQENQEKHKISSTPSFVINGEHVVTGNLKYEDFAKILDEHLAKVATE